MLWAFFLCVQRLGTTFKLASIPEDSHITKVALMGRGIFMLKLFTMECMSNLMGHPPIYAVDGKILSFVPRYRGFKASDFDAPLLGQIAQMVRHIFTILWSVDGPRNITYQELLLPNERM